MLTPHSSTIITTLEVVTDDFPLSVEVKIDPVSWINKIWFLRCIKLAGNPFFVFIAKEKIVEIWKQFHQLETGFAPEMKSCVKTDVITELCSAILAATRVITTLRMLLVTEEAWTGERTHKA